jgi:hypothetical protein
MMKHLKLMLINFHKGSVESIRLNLQVFDFKQRRAMETELGIRMAGRAAKTGSKDI